MGSAADLLYKPLLWHANMMGAVLVEASASVFNNFKRRVPHYTSSAELQRDGVTQFDLNEDA